ncbi:MAG: DUF6061 family protein [Clostridiales bacterium]|nr:DUF6061 family protein [Clostridiales bacterium]
MKKLRTFAFNMESGCVTLKVSDGSVIVLDCVKPGKRSCGAIGLNGQRRIF